MLLREGYIDRNPPPQNLKGLFRFVDHGFLATCLCCREVHYASTGRLPSLSSDISGRMFLSPRSWTLAQKDRLQERMLELIVCICDGEPAAAGGGGVGGGRLGVGGGGGGGAAATAT